MKKVSIIIIFIFLSFQYLFGNEVEYCQDYERLSKSIEKITDKKLLLEKVKGCHSTLQSSKEYTVLLAKLYILNENYFFAKKVLIEFYEKNPDCEIAGYIAYVDFSLNDTESLKESLSLCDSKDIPIELQSRFNLLRSFVENSNFEPLDYIYPEDTKLYLIVNSRYIDPYNYLFKVNGGIGYTTNAFSSNPLETDIGTDQGSFLIDYETYVKFTKGLIKELSLGMNANLKGTKFTNNDTQFSPDNLSNYNIALNPELEFKNKNIYATIKYKFDTLFLNMDTEYHKAPLQFFEGHRLEIFLKPLVNYSLFLGVGKRYFDEMVRSRNEFDGGVGYITNFSPYSTGLFLLTMRYYDAKSNGYDDLGESIIMKIDYKTRFKLEISQLLAFSFDDYMNSTGYFVDGKIREDKLLRYTLEAKYPILDYIIPYLNYTFSYRDSLIPDFDFIDHRFIAGVSISIDNKKIIPQISYKHDFERTYYSINSSDNNLQDIMNLLQENDSIQRGSQCKD